MSIETLERAIAKLEQLKEAAAPLPWSIQKHEESQWREPHQMVEQINARDGEPAVMQLGCSCCDFGLEGEPETFELVAALSRAVDPLIAMHRRSLLSMKAAIGAGMSEADVNEIAERSGEVALARAVLGEVSR